MADETLINNIDLGGILNLATEDTLNIRSTSSQYLHIHPNSLQIFRFCLYFRIKPTNLFFNYLIFQGVFLEYPLRLVTSSEDPAHHRNDSPLLYQAQTFKSICPSQCCAIFHITKVSFLAILTIFLCDFLQTFNFNCYFPIDKKIYIWYLDKCLRRVSARSGLPLSGGQRHSWVSPRHMPHHSSPVHGNVIIVIIIFYEAN